MKIQSVIKTILGFLFPEGTSDALLEKTSLKDLLQTAEHQPRTVSDIISFLPYRHEVVKNLIWYLKYRNSDRARELCAKVFWEMMEEELSDKILFQGGNPYLLIPIPMSKKRLGERGYDHMLRLAQTILQKDTSKLLTPLFDCLVRSKETPPQTSIKNKEARMKNVLGVFLVRNPESVAGKSIVLLDDVTTTGATLAEAKRVLLEAKAREVIALAIAH